MLYREQTRLINPTSKHCEFLKEEKACYTARPELMFQTPTIMKKP
jgi:hypothetical protein